MSHRAPDVPGTANVDDEPVVLRGTESWTVVAVKPVVLHSFELCLVPDRYRVNMGVAAGTVRTFQSEGAVLGAKWTESVNPGRLMTD